MQSRGFGLSDLRGVGLESSSNLGGGELLNLLGSTSDESTGIEKGVQLGDDGVEESGAADTVKQVVVLTLLLNVVGSLVREDTYRRKRNTC